MATARGYLISRFVRSVRRRLTGGGPARPLRKCPAPPGPRLRVEGLEDRSTPAPLAFDYPFGPPDGLPRAPGADQVSGMWQNVQEFGTWNAQKGGYHLGEDWNYGKGTDDLGLPVFAPADGVVAFAGSKSGWLGLVKIKHTGEMRLPGGAAVGEAESLCGHLDPNKLYVSQGQQVYRGQIIGVIGALRDENGNLVPHLHFEIRTQTGLGDHGYATNTAGWTDASNFVDANSPPAGPFVADFNAGDLSAAGLASARPGSSAAVATAVGSVTAPDRTRFMAVTTAGGASTGDLGGGQAGGTQGSVVYSKAFVVPAGGVLRFECNFLTSESPQSPVYNDFAAVNLLDAFGNKLATVKYVDTHATLGGGAAGGYARQTGWIAVALDLGPYASPSLPVKLQVVASDRGDNVVDSALLIDNLRVVTTRLSETFNAGTVRTAGLSAQPGASTQVVSGLGPVGPYNGSNFLLIDNKGATTSTTAFGGTTGSVLVSKPLLIPQNGVLSFAYNFLTNEATPESTYNDFAKLTLLTATEGVIAPLWGVDTTAPGFAGAAGSGYAKQTGWKTFGVNLSAYAGQQVKLQFVVSDKGDTGIDSALLLDNLFM